MRGRGETRAWTPRQLLDGSLTLVNPSLDPFFSTPSSWECRRNKWEREVATSHHETEPEDRAL